MWSENGVDGADFGRFAKHIYYDRGPRGPVRNASHTSQVSTDPLISSQIKYFSWHLAHHRQTIEFIVFGEQDDIHGWFILYPK